MTQLLGVNQEFANLIPPLSSDEYEALERSILDEGVRDPIVTWRGWIVDGHNRYEIATAHGLDFKTTEMDFEDENAAKEWMILNQFARRNISAYQRSLLALQLKPLIAARAKERQGTRTDLRNIPQKSAGSDTRDELARAAGVSHDTIAKVERIEREAPAELLEQARSGDVSINAAYQQVRRPHVANNSGNNEWYTPSEYIEAAREVMGGIDLDPASSDIANRTVGASTYYTAEMDGLSLPWSGRIWMNPPYSSDKIGAFAEKLVRELPNIEQACILVNNATETAWFAMMVEHASAVCFPRGRVKFLDPDGNASGAPLQGQAVLYIGGNTADFCERFGKFGWLAVTR